ncbi:MAG: ABC transporter permease [Chitinophagaceae bacterium]|nr:ABC transporter permease [Chitinophagaceae bacterium]
MFALIKIEWLKIKKYPAFWWMLGIVTLTYPGTNMMFYYIYSKSINGKEVANNVAKMLLGNPFAFPETWHTVAFLSSVFIIIPSILVIMLVTNEYNYKTHRQNIIDGWSRNQFVSSKLFDVMIISLVSTLMYVLVASIFGIYADPDNLNRWAEQLQYIPLFFIQTFAQLTIAFLIGFLIKKAFIALGFFLFYDLILEKIAVGYLRFKANDIGHFLPLEISNRILPWPTFTNRFGKDAKDWYEKSVAAIPEFLLYTIILTSAIWAFCYYLHKRRDL